MKTTFALLAASVAASALFALPVIGGPRMPAGMAAPDGGAGQGDARLLLVDEDGDEGWLLWGAEDHDCSDGDDDDDGDEDDDDDDEDEDEDGGDDDGDCAAGLNAAPAAPSTPPANGLFGSGAAPRVQVN